MESNRETARDKVLADIRSALKDEAPKAVMPPTDNRLVFNKQTEALDQEFIHAFEAIDGKVVCCADELQLMQELDSLIKRRNWTRVAARSRLLEQWSDKTGIESLITADDYDDLEQLQVGITDCEYLVARTGSIVMSTAQSAGRAFPVYVPVHVIIACDCQLVYDLNEAILKIEQRYHTDYPSAWYLVSGPSRTGDIEKTLVLGVHGPVEVYVFLMK